MAEERGYRACLIEAHEQKSLPDLLVPPLRRVLLDLDRLGALSEHAKRALRVFKGFLSTVKLKVGDAEMSIDVDPERGTADSGDLEADLPELFAAIGHAAAARQTPVAILIDEVQYLSTRDLSALIMALHRIAQDQMPVLMIAAGLPQVVGLSGRSKSYAERLFDFPPVDALSRKDAEYALQRPVREEGGEFAVDALDEILRLTQGYPYFLQEWGYQAWNTAQSPAITLRDVTEATVAAISRTRRKLLQGPLRPAYAAREGLSQGNGRAWPGPPPLRRHRGSVAYSGYSVRGRCAAALSAKE